jgi:hypothetical protein
MAPTSSSTAAAIEALCAGISASNGVTVLYDSADMSRADAIESMIEKAIAESGAILPIDGGWTAHRLHPSMTTNSSGNPIRTTPWNFDRRNLLAGTLGGGRSTRSKAWLCARTAARDRTVQFDPPYAAR